MRGLGALADYLQTALRSALAELNGLNPDYILSENEDVLVASLLAKHMPRPVSVEWDAVSRSRISEVTTTVRDQFHHDRTYTVPASQITLQFPLNGTKALLDHQASTFSLSGLPDGKILSDRIVLEVVERSLTPEIVASRVTTLRAALTDRTEWANTDLRAFVPTAEGAIRNSLLSRKQRILN